MTKSWWIRKSKEPEILVGTPGESIPCDDPKTAVVTPPKEPDPEPDLSTKPPDKVGYCFGYACPEGHITAPFEKISTEGFKERRACRVCGEVAKPATIRRIAEAKWVDYSTMRGSWGLPPSWGWAQHLSSFGYSTWMGDPLWSRYEFIHYLGSPKRKK